MRPTSGPAELRGKWVLKGQPALVDSTSPRYGEKASYYSAVCLETGEVEWMELEGNSNSGTSVAFLTPEGKTVIWDFGAGISADARPAVGEPAGVQPGLNADHLGLDQRGGDGQCLGSRARQEMVGNFLAGLASRKDG